MHVSIENKEDRCEHRLRQRERFLARVPALVGDDTGLEGEPNRGVSNLEEGGSGGREVATKRPARRFAVYWLSFVILVPSSPTPAINPCWPKTKA